MMRVKKIKHKGFKGRHIRIELGCGRRRAPQLYTPHRSWKTERQQAKRDLRLDGA